MKTFENNSTAILDGTTTDVNSYYDSAVAMVRAALTARKFEAATIRRLQEASRRFEELHSQSPTVPHYLDWLAEVDEALSIRCRASGPRQSHLNPREIEDELFQDGGGEGCAVAFTAEIVFDRCVRREDGYGQAS